MKHNLKAFPHDAKADNFNGMDLRDYFAAKAMQAVIAMDEDIDYSYIAAVAYEMADEMMEHRK